ncbi:hypothetical protein BD311DRAFT_812390 [Dichomitus squalens]|uniref:Uncharacterized protein n=1 Tax=Dichomitus squalens TaxID=114155 RepID=A0A4Q9M3L8_9APHY|nr:hypothetical protein BD311DRAFT_812390 [Dichomitus squalens]
MSSVNPEAQAMQTSDNVELLDSRTADPPVAHRCLINDMLPTELFDEIFRILKDAGWSMSSVVQGRAGLKSPVGGSGWARVGSGSSPGSMSVT